MHVLEQLHHSLILGVDFMTDNGAFINFRDNTLQLQDQPNIVLVPIYVSAALVRTKKSITISKFSQTLIPVSVSKQRNCSTVLLEPLNNSYPSLQNLVVAKCLVHVTNGQASLCLLNPTGLDIKLRAHTPIAKVACVDTDEIHPLDDKVSENTNVSTQSNEELNFDLSGSCLSQDERAKLENFLKVNRSVFATSLKELGCTHLYQHHIETIPGARPIKQGFYRKTPKDREEEQRQFEEMLENDIIEPSTSS